jgi:hypothetical protein
MSLRCEASQAMALAACSPGTAGHARHVHPREARRKPDHDLAADKARPTHGLRRTRRAAREIIRRIDVDLDEPACTVRSMTDLHRAR